MGALRRFAVLAILAGLLLAGCAKPVPSDTFCLWAEPIRPAPGETARLSERLVEQILRYNRQGAALCGWRA